MIKLVVDNDREHGVSPKRKALLGTVHIARKVLGLQEDDYRTVLARVTGHDSARDCNDGQLREAIAEFERLGFRRTGSARRRDFGDGVVIRKARAMWISLYQLGAIEDGSDAALEAFGRRQLHVERLQWSSEREGFRLIEALKAIASRHGWDQRVPSRLPASDRVRLLKDRLIGAQLARLEAAGITVPDAFTGDRTDWSDKRLGSAATALSAIVRAIPKTQ